MNEQSFENTNYRVQDCETKLLNIENRFCKKLPNDIIIPTRQPELLLPANITWLVC